MDELLEKLNAKDQEKMYGIMRQMVKDHGGGGLVVKYMGSMCKLLQNVYPEYLVKCDYHLLKLFIYSWDASRFRSTTWHVPHR